MKEGLLSRRMSPSELLRVGRELLVSQSYLEVKVGSGWGSAVVDGLRGVRGSEV